MCVVQRKTGMPISAPERLDFEQIPKILETPYIPSPTKEKKSYAPYKYEIAMLRASQFDKNFPDNIIAENEH